MKLCFFCFLILFSSLFSETSIQTSTSTRNAIESLTGQLFLHQVDAIAQGYEPIPIQRTYISENELSWEGGWAIFPHDHFYLHFELDPVHLKQTYITKIQEPDGQSVRYSCPHPNEDDSELLPDLSRVYDPRFQRELSGKTSPKNNRLSIHFGKYGSKAVLKLGNGGERIYRRSSSNPEGPFLLKEERKPNGSVLFYTHYEDHRLREIISYNPTKTKVYSTLNFKYVEPKKKDKNRDFSIETSDGKSVSYHFFRPPEKHLHDYFYLESVSGTGVTPWEFLYDMGYKKQDKRAGHKADKLTRGPLINQIIADGRPFLKFSYYSHLSNQSAFWPPVNIKNAKDLHCEKIQNLEEPLGEDGAFIPIYSFDYVHSTHQGPGITKVKDSYGNETHYYFDLNFKITRIDFYSEKFELIRTETFRWNGSHITLHCVIDPTSRNSFAKKYDFDDRENVTQVTLYGDLSGNCSIPLNPDNLSNGIESYTTTYDYTTDGFNLLKKKQEGSTTTTYSHKTNTNHLESQITENKEKIFLRHFYIYNDDNVLQQEIVDDANSYNRDVYDSATQRIVTTYTPNTTNFPEKIEEKAIDLKTQKAHLLKKRIFHYYSNRPGLVEQEDVYDNEEVLRYSLKYTYNNADKVASQTDALGHITRFKYSANHLLKEQYKEGGPVEVFCYNPSGDLIEIKRDDQVQTLTYDLLHYKNSETDPHGVVAKITNDRFGHPLTTILEKCHSFLKYDFFGNPEVKVDPKSYETKTAFNARGQPIRIEHPTGTEFFSYYLSGSLKEHIDLDQTKIQYQYDDFDRVRSIKTFSKEGVLVSEETKEYSTFHLLYEIDGCNYKTEYEYDIFGRKKSETREGRRTEFFYDSLGLLERTVQGELITVTLRDPLGHILEERLESSPGTVIQKRRFTYNSLGQIETETRFTSAGEAIYTSKYDAFGRIKLVTDPLGHTTSTEYLLKPHVHIATDPLGRKKIETFNSAGKISKVERQNEKNKTVALEEYFYDLSWNREKQTTTVYFKEQIEKRLETIWKYGPGDRPIEFIEAANTLDPRVTRYEYTPKGRLKLTVKPDLTILAYSYSPLGFLSTLKSSDGSIDYLYEHDNLGRLTQVTDLKNSLKTTIRLDAFGNVMKEELANGFYLSKEYDSLGQCKLLTFPDGTSVLKTYEGPHLKTVSRLNAYDEINPEARLAFTHTCSEYDLSGHLLNEDLSINGGQISYTFDLLGRCKEIHSPGYRQSIDEFNAVGKVKKMTTQGAPTAFDYDDLGQLISENQETFGYDSNFNRRLHNDSLQTIDDLNQLISTECATFTYDLCGNVKSKTTSSERLTFSYDALDRLIGVEKNDGSQVTYAYDPLHRRTYKTVNGTTTRYLYDGQNQIGIETGGHSALRILGDTSQAEIGAAIALELDGKCYLPIHDLQGSIIALIDPLNQTLQEESRYTAFGVGLAPSHINPWGYLSKCQDPETGFIFFGRRYYDPNVGRWMSTDPKGYTDSMNLYAYALNDPFLLVDFYGLENTFTHSSVDTLSSISGTSSLSQPYISMPTTGSLMYGRGTIQEPFLNLRVDNLFFPVALPMMLESGVLGSPFFNIEDLISFGGTALAKAGAALTAKLFATKNGVILGSGVFFSKNTIISQGTKQIVKTESGLLNKYTKSNIKLGQEMHKSYRAGETVLREKAKEFILPSKKRIDFLDIPSGKVYELKPNNPRAIRAGIKQLEAYINELKSIPRFKNIDWEGVLDTY